MMNEKNITKPELIKDRNLLIVENLSSFYKKKKILNNVSIQIKEGEIVGLLGPNGAGKTTCFQCIAGLQNIRHGSIKLNGLNITDLPIVAAGGIVDGRGMAAAFAAGAEGVQMGTRFVSCKESPVHENFKKYIIDSDEQGTWILNKKGKPCIRALKTDYTQPIYESGEMDMSAMVNIQDLYFGGNMNAAPALSGQSVGLISCMKPVKEIISETIKEFNEICSSMSQQVFDE